MNMELRSTGASFVAAKETNNPRDLVVQVIERAPAATRKDQFEEFRELLRAGDADYQRAVDWYFFVNMHDYMTTNRNLGGGGSARKSAVSAINRKVDDLRAQLVMLDLTMPNGKPMKECTGAEMAKFGNRFQRIADKVGKTKVVGEVLTEDQVKALFK